MIQVKKNTRRLVILHTIIMVILAQTACTDDQSQIERIRNRGNLRVAMIATPPLYFPDESLIKGYGYEMAESYATSLGVDLEVTRANTVQEIITQLKQGKAHIGIAGNAPGHTDDNIETETTYNNNEWYVIGNRENKLPKSIEDIIPSTIIVAKGSRPALVLKKLKTAYPSLFWLELPGGNTRQVLEQVNLNNFKLSVIDADVFTYYRYLYPELKIAISLSNQYPSHWMTHKNKDTSISESIKKFIEQYKNSGKLDKKYNTYFRHMNVFNYIDSLHYLRRIDITLPKYMPLFKAAAIDNEFDERFLAAISYQESHWNEKARSYTGVRGLMMLTLETAKRVGIKDRLDPEESIMGGAKYLNILKSSLAEHIMEPDRSWMTLAAYNVGLGHLEDARVLTEKLGDNPDLWIDVEKHLPKLSQKEWYSKTRHGYARGHEPVEFVRRIRRYYDILRLYQQEELLEKLDKPLELDNLQLISPAL